MIRSLRWRLLATTAAVLAVVLTALALVSSRITRIELRRFQEIGVTSAPRGAESVRRMLEERYRATRSWSGADEIASRAAGLIHREVFVVDDLGRAVARSAGLSDVRIEPAAGGGLRLTWGGAGNGQAHKILLLRAPGLPVIDESGRTVGRVYAFGPEPPDSPDLAGSVNRWLAVAVAAAGLLALLWIGALSRRLLGPIEALTAAARGMEQGDRTRRVAVVSRDEIGELARSFNEMAEAIARTETLRRALVTDVAHELRTPLTNIRAQLESLQDGLAAPTPRIIDSLHDDARKLERLVEDLQDLALAEANQLTFRVERVDVAGALAGAAAGLETRAARGDVAVAVRPAAGVPDVLADSGRLAQILANLLSNALTHTPPGGRIELAARLAETHVEISVSDSGNGISSEHLPHVFDRFYRADPSRARLTGGTGLGLAIVRQLVRSQGGDVRVESEPGRGSVFSFTLPSAG